MINVLWADDQTEIVHTFKPFLAPLSSKITIAKNGNEAIEKLRTNYYDLLILDLKMPPDEWGGLWALEELRKFNHKIPIIILSGEGTQNETIKALRLGAQDYVTKDKVQTDLLQRVEMALRDTDKLMVNDLINNFPTVIALPYKRYVHTSEPVTRLHRMLEFYESLIRIICFIGISEIEQSNLKHSETENFRATIQSPSMGTWNQSRSLFLKYLSSDTAFARLNKVIDNNFSSSLVKTRNDIAHGAEPSEKLASQLLSEHEDTLLSITKALWQSFDYDMLLPLKFQFDGSHFEVDGVLLSGNNSALPKTSISISKPLITAHVYLYRKEPITLIDLFPFIVAESSHEPSTWQIMVFDSLKVDKNAKNLSGAESIRYIDLLSGQRNILPVSNPTSNTLPKFLTGL